MAGRELLHCLQRDEKEEDVYGLISQEPSSLEACYTNTESPVLYTHERFIGRSLDWKIIAFGAAARKGIFIRSLFDELLDDIGQGVTIPRTDEARLEYAWFLFSQKAWPALHTYIARWPAPPLHVADLFFLSFYRMQMKHIVKGEDVALFNEQARSCLRHIAVTWPAARGRYQAYAAMVDHILGHVPAARETLANSTVTPRFAGPLSAVDSILPAAEREDVPDVKDISFKQCAMGQAVLTSVDENYFNRYAELFAKVYFSKAHSFGLHFHCIGFDPEDRIGQWHVPARRIGWSIDRTDLSRLNRKQRSGYYASARYMYLLHYLQYYSSVLVADIDGRIIRPVGTIGKDHMDDDVVFGTSVLDTKRGLNRLPWEAVSAGLFMINATDASKRFARYLAAYHHHVLSNAREKGLSNWYADQNALFFALHDLPDTLRVATFRKTSFRQGSGWKLFEGDTSRISVMREAL